MMQFDMFAATAASPIFGLTVELEHFRTRCHDDIACIAEGKGPHLGELKCAACGRHRGWISKSTGKWIESVVERFGRPTQPLVLRVGRSQ
jgi:hypothetical protein